jgi:hypothetical protein
MQTYAVGRFLVDIPVLAKDVSMSQRVLGVDIEWVKATEGQYGAMLSTRVRGLTGGSPATNFLVSDTMGIMPKSRIIMFEEDKTRDGFIGFEAYRYAEEIGGYFILKESADRARLAIVIPWVNRIISLIKPRIIDEKIADRGTCMDHAFIPGNDPVIHDTIAIMAVMGDIAIGFSTQVADRIDDGPSLLERAKRVDWFPEAKILRKSKRKIAGLDGAEFAFIDTPQAFSAYSFQWEYQGQANSIIAPKISASMDSKGPVSIPDVELFELWDAILESIRMRPGAV